MKRCNYKTFNDYWIDCKVKSGLGRFIDSAASRGKSKFKDGFLHQMCSVYKVDLDNALLEFDAWCDFIQPEEWKYMTFDSGVFDAKEAVSYWSE